MKFRYKAFDKGGRTVTDVTEGASVAEATESLRSRGLFVAEIRPEGGGEPRRTGPVPAGPRGGRLKTIATFTRHLAVLVSTGTPVVEALAALEKQTRDERWASIVGDVRARIEEGTSFSEAMAAHPKSFDAVCRSLVAAGESGGKLDVMLSRLADLTRQQHKVRSSLIGAMVYPCLLMVVAVGVLATMLGFVMPRFTGLFTTLGVPLPPTTRALMAISEFLRAQWPLMLGGLIAVVAGVWWWATTPDGRRRTDMMRIRAPQLGRIVRSLATARIARILGVLLEAKVPLLEALELTRQACTNIHYVELLTHTQDVVTRGDSFSSAIASGGLIEPSVCEAVRNAERTGQVATVLLSMADFLDEENEVIVRTLTSVLEPLILIVLGVVVGLVATSMFLPLFDLTAMSSSGGAS